MIVDKQTMQRMELLLIKAKQENTPIENFHAMCFIDVVGTGVSRILISRDPTRRRDEIQSGCPWKLQIRGVIFADKNVLELIKAKAEIVLVAGGRSDECLRDGWWDATASELQEVAETVSAPHPTVRRPIDWTTLCKHDFDLREPLQHRMYELLSLLKTDVIPAPQTQAE